MLGRAHRRIVLILAHFFMCLWPSQSLCEIARSPLAPLLVNDPSHASLLLQRLFRLSGDDHIGKRLWQSNEFVYDAATTLVLALAQAPMQQLLSTGGDVSLLLMRRGGCLFSCQT
jgi:hypothetical protein